MLVRNEVVRELVLWDFIGAKTSIEIASILFPQL
jgi:hypothetical protein